MLLDVLNEAAVGPNLAHDLGQRRNTGARALGLVQHGPFGEVHFKLIAFADSVRVHDDYREADVNGIAEENARETLGDDGAYARQFDDRRRVLTARSLAEVPAADHEVPLLHLPG